jgi:hypothetical protein
MIEAYSLGPMPTDRRMTTVDEQLTSAPLPIIFALAADVERWPAHLEHYRYVRFLERRADGGGLVEMSANRPFGAVQWPTHWTSQMSITPAGISRDAGDQISTRSRRYDWNGRRVDVHARSRQDTRAHRARVERTIVAVDS